MAPATPPQDHVHPETRAAWRAWLAANHDRDKGVWLVSWKAATKRPALSYEEIIEEALCFGWVDSTAGTVDAERTKLWIAPRKQGSGWARTNKERIVRLEAAGLMEPAGAAVIAAAKADGSWTLLDSVENMEVPDDLAAALAATPGAQTNWDAFPPSARKQFLAWIVTAKKPETRTTRVQRTADMASRNERL